MKKFVSTIMHNFMVVLGWILLFVGFGCVLFAVIEQQIVCYQMFGAVFKQVFIPHWSAWFYFGTVPMFVGYVMLRVINW